MELKWRVRNWCCDVPDGGVYTIETSYSACSPDAELAYYGWTGARTLVSSYDEDGNARDWPSAEMAKLAAQQHYERMRTTGETPDVAASRIPTDPAWYEAKMGGAGR